jgi:hypothetical protein
MVIIIIDRRSRVSTKIISLIISKSRDRSLVLKSALLINPRSGQISRSGLVRNINFNREYFVRICYISILLIMLFSKFQMIFSLSFSYTYFLPLLIDRSRLSSIVHPNWHFCLCTNPFSYAHYFLTPSALLLRLFSFGSSPSSLVPDISYNWCRNTVIFSLTYFLCWRGFCSQSYDVKPREGLETMEWDPNALCNTQ